VLKYYFTIRTTTDMRKEAIDIQRDTDFQLFSFTDD
jgi:hypothetical protein